MTRFAEGAGRLAGIAGWLLGWRPDEFWRATPAELRAVLAAMRGDDAPVDGVDAGALARLMQAMPDCLQIQNLRSLRACREAAGAAFPVSRLRSKRTEVGAVRRLMSALPDGPHPKPLP